MTSATNIILIGPRGSGKSTLARRLSHQLWMRFVDMDERTLERFKESTVAAVWAAHGEDGWRATETDVMRELLGETGLVIASGGGAPTVPQIAAMLDEARAAGRARVIYLRCAPDVLRRRLEGATDDRPSLTGADPLDEIETIAAQRDPIYRAVADAVLDVTFLEERDAAEYLVRNLL